MSLDVTSPVPDSAGPPHGSRRLGRARRRGGLLALVAGSGLLLVACGGGPGSQEDFNDVLVRDENLTADEAACISDAVFERYGDDEDALGTLSAAPDFEFLSGEDGIDGFAEFYDETVAGCAQVGPSN